MCLNLEPIHDKYSHFSLTHNVYCLAYPYLATQRNAMVLARNPSTTKTTSEASTDVMKLMPETISASLWQLLWIGL